MIGGLLQIITIDQKIEETFILILFFILHMRQECRTEVRDERSFWKSYVTE